MNLQVTLNSKLNLKPALPIQTPKIQIPETLNPETPKP